MEESVRRTVRSWFSVTEAELKEVDYGKTLTCAPNHVSYINAVVRIRNRSWRQVCGSPLNAAVPALQWGYTLGKILDAVVPTLPLHIDVAIPFGLRDSVHKKPKNTRNQHVPVFAAMYHNRYAHITIPFGMGCWRDAERKFENTPVIGWERHVKTWLQCNHSEPQVKKAVFRGTTKNRTYKYGACTKPCGFKDNGRLFVHWVGEQRPDLFDTAVSNADQFNAGLTLKSPEETYIPMPEQLCKYQAILNIGSNMDWAERLRLSFYGNAVIVLPDTSGDEFYRPFMEPYKHYWPVKSDLSNIVEEVAKVMDLTNRTQQVQGQKDFAARYLTEDFMLYYNRVAIEEYDRRVREYRGMKRAGLWRTGRSLASVDEAKRHLKISGCAKLSSELEAKSCTNLD